MRTHLICSVLCAPVLFLSGCLTVGQYGFSFDFNSGEVQRFYHDLRSRQGTNDEKDYSVEKDWAGLKKLVESTDSEPDPDVVQDVSKRLFRENEVLSGAKVQKVRCPKCFPSKAAVLAFLHEKDWRFEMLNDEIFLFLPNDKHAVSSNGRIIKTAANTLIVWPGDATKFEYVVTDSSAGGESLLPFYVKEEAQGKAPAK